MTVALGKKGKVITSEVTKTKNPDHWVIKNNVNDTNRASSNTRYPEDKSKMYKGDVTLY